MMNAGEAIGQKAFDGDHHQTLIHEIRGITEVTAVLDGNYRFTETPEMREVTAGDQVLHENRRSTDTPEMREVKVNLEAIVGQKVSDGTTTTSQMDRCHPQRGDTGIGEGISQLSKRS